MDIFLKELTHDNNTFQHEWKNINKRSQEVSISNNDGKIILNILADYVINEPNDRLPCQLKYTFIQNIIQRIAKENLSISLDDIIQVFLRVLDDYSDGYWHLTMIESIYVEFKLAQKLCSQPIQIHLIEQILNSLRKKSFINKITTDDNRWEAFLCYKVFSNYSTSDLPTLNNDELMEMARKAYQQFYRCAIKNKNSSTVWSALEGTLKKVLLQLFDKYDSLTDMEEDLILYPNCPDHNYLYLLISSFDKNLDLFKTNYIKLLETIERLILINKFIDASILMDRVIKKHLKSVDLSPLLQTFIRICSTLMNSTDLEPRNILCSGILYYLSSTLRDIKANKNLASLFFDLMISTLKLNVIDAPKCIELMIYKQEYYPWKDLGLRITELVSNCISYESIRQKSFFSNLDSLQNIIKTIDDRAKTNPIILRSTHDIALQAILRWSRKDADYSIHVYKMCYSMLNLIDKNRINVDVCSQFLTALIDRIHAANEDDQEEFFGHQSSMLFVPMSEKLFTFLEQLSTIPQSIHEQLSSFILLALDRPLNSESGTPTLEYFCVRNLWSGISSIINKESEVRIYFPCLDRMYILIIDDDEKNAKYWWTNFWVFIGMKFPQVVADRLEQILTITIDRKDMTCSSILPALYTQRPQPFHDRLDDLVNELFVDNAQHLYILAYMIFLISKEHPELITLTHLKHIFSSIDDLSTQNTGMLFQALNPVANSQPHLFDTYQTQLLDRVNEKQDLLAYICLQQYLIASAVINGEEKAKENLNILIDILKNPKTSSQIQSYVLHGIQLIGVKYKDALNVRRNDLMEFQSNSTCQSILDYIDGQKMTEENQVAIKRAQDEIELVEQRVIRTEDNVQQISETIKEQEINTNNIRTRVEIVDTRLTNVTEQVEKQAREIERIDGKTLSYVPEWGRQVSKLLNHRSDNDWRLLGKRFGYSTSELKHWAMQFDPCMTLLNEWYMTHKTDEATYGLLKILKEINRTDAENIIRQAITATGEIIPDDLPDDIKRLPPVFLSYQWGSQAAVIKLKSHLEQAGYACWMDVGQMGGGDKLYSKIDAGIRGAKVVICCMTTAYAQSDNCSREVHLSISTGKPIIPLQMEKQTWPPEGALGPIMSEYLFIRFFDRKSTGDPNFWPEERFTELLGQIRYHVAPDPDMITETYHNWFVPKVDNLIFIQPTKTQTSIPNDIPLVVTHPQIMISYNWDRQGDIVNLYQRLTQLGYRIWLDIFQMGGGDSLFDKIDSGIRHSLCVIACITPKYTLSINCRREMALADALKKPIIPLLLEKTSTWPPPGPMSLVFADKIYIDFSEKKPTTTSKNDLWTHKEFQHILALLKQYIPEVQTANSSRYLLDMQRPISASKNIQKRSKRISSAPIIPQSQACSIM